MFGVEGSGFGFGCWDLGFGVSNYFTEMCSSSEAGSYLRLIDFVYHSTLGLRVIKKRRRSLGVGVSSPQPLRTGVPRS